MTHEWFDDIPVLANLDEDERIEVALSMDEHIEGEGATDLNVVGRRSLISGARKFFYGEKKAYEHTSHVFGHIGLDGMPKQATLVQANADLRGAKIKITLDQVRIAKYPGSGLHEILFDFYGQNQVEGDKIEHVHFNCKYAGMEGDNIAVLSQPIFVGLNVGQEGVVFKCRTVNVKNRNDELILKILDEDVFKAGLELSKNINPAVGIVSKTAYLLTKLIASRNRNISVQDFCLGLDFSTLQTRARLAEGAYIAIQVPEEEAARWNWNDWIFEPSNGRLAPRGDVNQMIPYNYIILGVSRIAS